MSEWSSWRIAASVEQLALEMYEELLGYKYGEAADLSPSEDHKPMRPDIAKLKQYADMEDAAKYAPEAPGDLRSRDMLDSQESARQQWDELTELTADEREAQRVYTYLFSSLGRPEDLRDSDFIAKLFDITVGYLSGQQLDWQYVLAHALGGSVTDFQAMDQAAYSPAEAKKSLASALRKQQIEEAPRKFETIKGLLNTLLKDYPETYKLWPWAVKQVKTNDNEIRPGHWGFGGASHLLDIVREGGQLLQQLRQENRIPANLDINQMGFSEFEKWLMQWKRDNREQDSQGEMIYKFSDGWSIQHLTTPEQLQFEGEEMGHCVGSYSEPVNSGASQIYSLRDDKGNPHATIEIRGFEVPFRDAEPYASDYRFGPHTEQAKQVAKSEPDFEWYVEQIQGKENDEPKSEYKHRIKEFFDSLREQGMKIEKTPGGWWNEADDEIEIHDPNRMSDWADDFKHKPQRYLGGGSSDEYGMALRGKEVTGWSPDEAIQTVARLLLNRPDQMYDAETHAQDTYYYLSHTLPLLADHTNAESTISEINSLFEKYQSEADEKLEQNHHNWYDQVPALEDNEEEYYAAIDQVEQEFYRESGYQAVFDYLNYLNLLIAHHGIPESKDLPHADNHYQFTNAAGQQPLGNYKDGSPMSGLPQYSELQQMPWPQKPGDPRADLPQDSGDGPQIPGALSSWHTAELVGDHYESDPEFLYVYYGSELHVEPWEVNLRYEKLLEQLFDHFGVDMNNIVLDIDPTSVDAGEIRTQGPEVLILHKQLNDPEIREQAEEAIRAWWEEQHPRTKLFDWYNLERWEPFKTGRGETVWPQYGYHSTDIGPETISVQGIRELYPDRSVFLSTTNDHEYGRWSYQIDLQQLDQSLLAADESTTDDPDDTDLLQDPEVIRQSLEHGWFAYWGDIPAFAIVEVFDGTD